MGRLVTERSKEAASATSGAGLPSASGCKDPLLPLVLSLSFAPELCSGAFLCSIPDQGSPLLIPFDTLLIDRASEIARWESITHPL